MQREAFYDYLHDIVGYGPQTCRSRVGNCATIEEHEGDLDEQFAHDNMQSLLDRLQYSKSDERANAPARHRIPINGNIYNGTATLRSAANLYLAFLRGEDGRRCVSGARAARKSGNGASRGKNKHMSDWPLWEQPSNEDSRLLAKTAIRYVKFLNPRVVEAIAADNIKRQAEWSDALRSCNIDPALYLWVGSPCAFPGVRRHAGSREINRLHDSSTDYSDVPDAICLDDNDYPKQVWSFVFRNTQFSKFGPTGYRLAHLFDHKAHNNRMADEVEKETGSDAGALPGLYTCPSNTAYICGGLIHPTDFNSLIRNLLQRRAYELYANCCNILPPGLKVRQASEGGWGTHEFDWCECVGTLNHMGSFLDFRARRVESLLSTALSESASIVGERQHT